MNKNRGPALWLLFPALFAAIAVTHLPLLGLPYYWDEAGYYIPAAYDFFRSGSLIPYSTLSNAHPPVPSLYLAACWMVFGFTQIVTRTAMGFIAAVALLAVYRLGIVARCRTSVALAATLLTLLYPVWFAQSSLAHADVFAAAATLWALVFALENRIWFAAFCFAIAALSKETAIATPLALAAWIAASPFYHRVFSGRKRQGAAQDTGESRRQAAILLLPLVPLACWYLYHWLKTGFVFGNPEYLRYNATATLSVSRMLLALMHRILHITAHMNLFTPVLGMIACMIMPPLAGREPILRRALTLFSVVIAANVIFFSVLGGALLTRYLLPLYPLVLLLCVHTFYRHLRAWPALAAFSAFAFVAGLFINPPYRFAPEDNLAYRDVILLHQSAIAQIQEQYPNATVLTAWPATDELTKPELGYVKQPMPVATIDNFSLPQIVGASKLAAPYSVGLIFSTKYDPPHLPLNLGHRNEALDTRYFDFHRDLPPEMIAHLLHGKVTWKQERKGQWAAMVHFDRPDLAQLENGPRRAFHYNQP